MIFGSIYYFNDYQISQDLNKRQKMADQLAFCTTEMKQIGVGLRRYADEHGGKYPDSLVGLIGSKYLPSPQLFIDPATTKVPSGDLLRGTLRPDGRIQYGSYIYLGEGVSTADSLSIPILMEPNSPHFIGNGNNLYILFLDGRLDAHNSLKEAEKDH